MPPKIEKKVTAEEIIKVFLDTRVIDALIKSVNPAFCELVKQTLDDKLKPVTASITSIVNNVRTLENRVETLTENNASIVEENNLLKKQLSEISNYSRRDNLIIQGLESSSYAEAVAADGGAPLTTPGGGSIESSNAATEKAVVSLAQSMGLNISTDDISVAHRLPTKKSTPGTTSNASRSPAIIVKFVKRRTRDLMYGARKQLKTIRPGVYINEHLTPENAALHRAARVLCKQKKLFAAWTSQGEVLTKLQA